MRVNRPIDQWLLGIDRGLKTMTGSLTTTERFQHKATNETLSDSTKASSAALMRINHCGEVCAQGLYHGQALSARRQSAKDHLLSAAGDEQKHLIWCQERLKELEAWLTSVGAEASSIRATGRELSQLYRPRSTDAQ